MGKLKNKKLKKWGTRSRHHAERAEAAADRAEAALRRIAVVTGQATGRGLPGDPHDERQEEHHPAYTRPRDDAALADTHSR